MAYPTPLIRLGLLLLLAGCAAPRGELSAGTDTPGPADARCALPSVPSAAPDSNAAAPAALPDSMRAVFVLDTSGSMVGLGDGKADIFEQVKAAVLRYVTAHQPTQVEVFTFNSGLKSRQSYTLPADRAQFEQDMQALQANGNNTHLYRSVGEALGSLSAQPTQLTNVFVLTDGVDNDPSQQVSAAQAVSAYAARGPLDSFHYLALGTEIPAEAAQALAQDSYAEGRTYPVGQVPDLTQLGNRVQRVQAGSSLPLNLPDGTPVQLHVPLLPGLSQVSLEADQVQGGRVPLRVLGEVPSGTPGLLCADTAGLGGTQQSAGRLQKVLLRFELPGTAGLRLLNPGADRTLRPGETVTLRYSLSQDALSSLTPDIILRSGFNTSPSEGLAVERLYEPGGRHLGVRLTNTGLPDGQTVPLNWLLPDGRALSLGEITGAAGRSEGLVAPAADTRPGIAEVDPGTTAPAGSPAAPATDAPDSDTDAAPALSLAELWPLLLGLALAAAGLWLLRQNRGQPGPQKPAGLAGLKRRPAPKPAPSPLAERARAGTQAEERPRHVTVSQAQPVTPVAAGTPAFDQDVPTIEGLEYSDDRFLCLFGTDGRMGTVNAPSTGAFDVGQVAGVPHLSGLRVERHRAGLRVLRAPADLEVSQGTRLLGLGDVVRPGTLLGLQMAESSRAKTPPLGELSGLGLPLHLTADAGDTLKVVGRYAEHHLGLPGGVTDLGEACKAPSLRGLRVTLVGGRVLIADIPARLRLQRPRVRGESGEQPPLRPGTFLPPKTEIHFKGYEDSE
ncbi:vWA domain-containing protein [Deinococcus radiophilus]|uniref:vWA domain-containing protein n=1 Tax=Deinococcus radiophilus TaxID=32062 RepID=UPI001E3407DA|nr:vWA domain-containing protein [Deinococcus radiophilus]UFA49417.1 VWA domain-containing protein [Deinococcus radiophilus]